MSSSSSVLAGAKNLSWISTRPVIFAPASWRFLTTSSTYFVPDCIDSTSTRWPVSLLASTYGAVSVANCSCRLVSSLRWLTWSRYCWFCLRSAFTSACRLSESGPLSAAVPSTSPIASARKTAVNEATWYRKLIPDEASSVRSREQREHQVVPPLRDDREVRLADGGHRQRGGHRRDGGQDEQQQRRPGQALPVQPAHALRVDELAAHLEPGEEGRGHAAPALVKELDERGVRADGDDD